MQKLWFWKLALCELRGWLQSFQFCRLLYVLLIASFTIQKFYCFMSSHLLVVDLRAWTVAVLFRNLSSVPMHSRIFPTVCSMRFSVSIYMLRALTHIDLSFVQSIDVDLLAFSTCRCPVRPASYDQDYFFYPVYYPDSFTKNQVFIGVWIYICVFWFHWSTYLFSYNAIWFSLL